MVLIRLNGGWTVVSSLSDGSSSVFGGEGGALNVEGRFEMEGRLVRT